MPKYYKDTFDFNIDDLAKYYKDTFWGHKWAKRDYPHWEINDLNKSWQTKTGIDTLTDSMKNETSLKACWN